MKIELSSQWCGQGSVKGGTMRSQCLQTSLLTRQTWEKQGGSNTHSVHDISLGRPNSHVLLSTHRPGLSHPIRTTLTEQVRSNLVHLKGTFLGILLDKPPKPPEP
jgi:hypothetical protein